MPPARHIILWFILSLLLGYSIYSAVTHYDISPYNDLRNRVVGSRLADAGQSPYFHKWQAGEPETWADPFEKQQQIVNGNTVTPVTLGLFSWLNGMDYDTIKWTWIVFTFACFAGALALIILLLKKYVRPPYLAVLPAMLLISGAWKLHLFSGQVYIFYALLMLLFFYLFSAKHFFAAGLVVALLVAMRPPALLLFLPLLFRLEKKMLLGGVTALLLIAVFHVVNIIPNTWPDYFRSMKIHAQEIPGKIPEIPVNTVLPAQPEHIDLSNAAQMADYQHALSPDILSVQKILPVEGFLSQPFVLWLLLLAVYALLLLFTVKMKPVKKMSAGSLLLLGFVLYILSEYFLPAPRFTYNFVQWLYPLAILVCTRRLYPGWRLGLLLSGVFLNIVKLPFIPDAYSVGELLLLAATLGYLFRSEKTGENNRAATKFAT